MKALNGNTILSAPDRLGARLNLDRNVEILLVGGAAAVLTGQLPSAWTTADVDVIHFHHAQDRDDVLITAGEVAIELSLPPSWLSEDVGLFIWTLPTGWMSRRVKIGTFAHLHVFAASRIDLIVMKFLSHRPGDLEHLEQMKITWAELASAKTAVLQIGEQRSTIGEISRGPCSTLKDGKRMTDKITQVASQWVRLGAMLNVEAAQDTPDVENLLLDTARIAPGHSRLFILAASWLALDGEYVLRGRLTNLIRDALEQEHRPTLGFLLEWAKENSKSNGKHFDSAIKACGSAVDARPLLDVERQSETFARLAKERASVLSLKWGRWLADFDLRHDAIRTAEWVAANNHALAVRALTGGNLVGHVLAECHNHGGTVDSEASLARLCCASRPAIRNAVHKLVLGGKLRVVRKGKSHAIEVIGGLAIAA